MTASSGPAGAAIWATWAICALATAGVIVRPFRLPEAIWAAGGAALLLVLGLVSAADAGAAVLRGGDVYLFLTGMMLLSETARREGLFDWVAATAVNHARGSARRLFLLVFVVGTVTTIFLSNDATAVVLTPAVYAVARKGEAEPLPLLFACAFIANAASFVLPISNPANLVLYGGAMPPLGTWLAAFAAPSVVAIALTYAALRLAERKRIGDACARVIDREPLTRGGRTALAGIGATAILLLITSALDAPLGLPTCLAGAATMAAACIGARASPLPMLRAITWSVLPLVAGLFVLVEALDRTGLIATLAAVLRQGVAAGPAGAAAASGAAIAFASNLTNNLPAGLIASLIARHAHSPALVTDGLLIGVDLGPNLSITGSLATILWLATIRREGEDVGFWRFLKVGAVVMPPALFAALATRIAIG